jgi:O-Antigen ligase
MSSSIATVRARRDLSWATPAAARERWARRRVGIAWGLLFLNALTFYPGIAFVHIPSALGKGITQGALPAALLVALTVNRRIAVRPNVFLCLVGLLVIEALVTSLQAGHFGTVYRTFRLAGFVVTLWLLSPWWGRRDVLLVRCHLAATCLTLGTVLLGLLVAPGHALPAGRLTDALWPSPPPQVAHYAAVTTGLVVVLWLCGELRGRVALPVAVVAAIMLLMTHTRTALVAMIAGVLVAGMSLFVARSRARKSFAAVGVVAAIAIMTLSSVITTWLARGEGTQQLTDLTGRTAVWNALVSLPRDKFQVIFGFGLSNKSFNGLPIDSNWLASYYDQGLFGVAICATILLFLLVTACLQVRGMQRALVLFLVTYCLVASFTEVGFTDASTYLLELTLAASLLVSSLANRRQA